MWYDRSKNVELTLQCFLQSIVEAIGFLGFTLEEPKDIAIETFVVDELISLSRIIEDDDATSVAICKTLEQLAHRSPKVRRVIFNTDGFHVMIELFKHRSPSVKAAAAMTAAAVLRDHTDAVVEAKTLGASMLALEWIEKRYNEGKSGEADSCAAMELLAMLCCDENVESCRGLQAIHGDHGLNLLLNIIVTGNDCANVAAKTLSNTLATSDGPESAAKIMECGGLGKVCKFLKTCSVGITEPLIIAETLKVVKEILRTLSAWRSKFIGGRGNFSIFNKLGLYGPRAGNLKQSEYIRGPLAQFANRNCENAVLSDFG